MPQIREVGTLSRPSARNGMAIQTACSHLARACSHLIGEGGNTSKLLNSKWPFLLFLLFLPISRTCVREKTRIGGGKGINTRPIGLLGKLVGTGNSRNTGNRSEERRVGKECRSRW